MWGLHLFAVLVVIGTLLMGLWQLGVYDSRRADERADKRAVPTVSLAKVLGPDDAFTGRANLRPVTVSGEYAPTKEQFWVSGRKSGGRTGYWLVAPFVVDDVPATSTGRKSALLVVRGWSRTRGTLPATMTGHTEVRAVLQAGESADGGIGSDRTTSSIRIPLLVNELPHDLYSGYGIVTKQEPADPASLTAVRPPLPGTSWTTGLRNLVYAIQWWVFGAFGLLMWWRMGSEQVATAREGRTRDADDSAAQVA